MISTQSNEWLLVLLCPPGKTPQPAGILLLDARSGKLTNLKRKADETAGALVISWLNETASHTIQFSSPRAVDDGQTLDDLYREYIDPTHVKVISRVTGA